MCLLFIVNFSSPYVQPQNQENLMNKTYLVYLHAATVPQWFVHYSSLEQEWIILAYPN